jgi:hypothetical protein
MKIVRSQTGHVYIGLDPGFIRAFGGEDKLLESGIQINDEGNIVITFRKDAANISLEGTYIRIDKSGSKYYLEFGPDLVQAFGEHNLLKSRIEIDNNENIVIIPSKKPKELEDIKQKTQDLIRKYRDDITLLKD